MKKREQTSITLWTTIAVVVLLLGSGGSPSGRICLEPRMTQGGEPPPAAAGFDPILRGQIDRDR